MPNPIRLYRVVGAVNIEDIDRDKPGEHVKLGLRVFLKNIFDISYILQHTQTLRNINVVWNFS